MPDSAEKIRRRLRELDRSPAWLAKRLDVNQALTTRWLLHGDPIPLRRLREIALVLHVPAKDLEPDDELATEPTAEHTAA